MNRVNEFLYVLLDMNENLLATKYALNSKSFTQDGRLNPDIHNFLYKEKYGGYLPVVNIVSKKDFFIKIIPQTHGSYIVLFMKDSYRDSVSDISFLEGEWMKKYFACEFEFTDGELSFYQNICFAETGGPFPPEYDF